MDGFQLFEHQLQDEIQFYQLQPTAQGVQRNILSVQILLGFFSFEWHLLHLTLRGRWVILGVFGRIKITLNCSYNQGFLSRMFWLA